MEPQQQPLVDARVKMDLRGPSGNAFAIMGLVRGTLRAKGRADLVEAYTKEATSGDYENLLRVTGRYVHFSYVR